MNASVAPLARVQANAGIGFDIRHQLFIGGRLVDALDGQTLTCINPHDTSPIAEVSMAGRADADRAVAAAQAALPRWSRLSGSERGRILLKLADRIEANVEELARLESLDTGHPLRDSRALAVPRTAACFRYFGGIADKRLEARPGAGGRQLRGHEACRDEEGLSIANSTEYGLGSGLWTRDLSPSPSFRP